MGLKFKYTLDGSEPIVKIMKAVPDTYANGEAMATGSLEAGGLKSAGDGDDTFFGVTNEAKTPTGTQAAGTIEGVKVIVNPWAVYAAEYDNSARITWSAIATTSIAFACTGTVGFASAGGGWAWSYATGYLDYVVSSASSASVCTLTTVTATNTTSATGILLQPAGNGLAYPITLTAAATAIDADAIDVATAGTAAYAGVILSNHITSATYGDEVLDPRVNNKAIRFMSSNTSYKDLARAYAYVCFFKSSSWNNATLT